MNRYFVNLAPLGWVELYNNDFIDGQVPKVWFLTLDTSKQFVTVRYKNQEYTVHISQFPKFKQCLNVLYPVQHYQVK